MNEDMITVIPGVEYLTYEQMNILINYQKLWSQFAMWMRNFIFSNLEDLDNLPATTKQLFDTIPLDFYNSFKMFYGPEISRQFLNVFSKFLESGLQLINAYKINDASRINSTAIQWYQSADELSAFLAKINIYWSKEQWVHLLYHYIGSVINEIIAIKSGEFENEINIYNNIDNLSDLLGSYMGRGIIARSIGI